MVARLTQLDDLVTHTVTVAQQQELFEVDILDADIATLIERI